MPGHWGGGKLIQLYEFKLFIKPQDVKISSFQNWQNLGDDIAVYHLCELKEFETAYWKLSRKLFLIPTVLFTTTG